MQIFRLKRIGSNFSKIFGGQGEHLRLTKDQWNLLVSKFGIYGVPYYIVVNKQGEVVDNNSGRIRIMTDGLDVLDKLIEE